MTGEENATRRADRKLAREALRFPTWRPSDAEVAAAMVVAKPQPVARKCRRCNGTGFLAFYAHRNNGRCMSCEGTRVEQHISAAAQKRWEAEFRAVYTPLALARIEAQAAQVKSVMIAMPEARKPGARRLADLRRHWVACRN